MPSRCSGIQDSAKLLYIVATLSSYVRLLNFANAPRSVSLVFGVKRPPPIVGALKPDVTFSPHSPQSTRDMRAVNSF